MLEETKLIEKFKRIEALFAGAKTDGEKNAAFNAMERIQKKLLETKEKDSFVEYKFSLPDEWAKKLYIALLRRYGLKPYRYYRQKHTTVMVKAPSSFMKETLLPEFRELDETLNSYLESITDRIISEHIHSDDSDVDVKNETKYLKK